MRKPNLFQIHVPTIFVAALLMHFGTTSASAQALYWDKAAGAGFGTAGGTWSGTASLWTTDAAGTGAAPGTTISTTSDTVNFGTGSLGLAAGTITVSGTVQAGNITFDDNSGNIILSGGTINLGAAATVSNGGKINTINSALSGAATSLAFTGGGTVIFTGAGAAGFGAGASATVSGSTILRFSSGGTGALGGSTGFNINLGNATTGGTLAFGNSGSLGNQITVVAGTGTRTISNSGSPSGTFAGTIIANENLAVNNSGSNSINTSGGSSSTIATSKTVTYTASSTGSMLNSALFGGLGAIAYTGSSAGNITISGAKTYSGGTSLNAMSGTGSVIVNTSSNGPANAPTDGAFGTGTLTIGATKMRAGTTADITVGNPITFSGNPTFPTIASEKSLIFSGDASLAATRTLTVETGSPVAGEFVEFSGNISGGFGIIKAGAGVLRLSGGNTYSGETTLNGGKLVGVVGGNSSSSTVNLNNLAATLGVSVADNTLSWNCSALTSSAAGVIEFNYGATAVSTTVPPLVVTNLAAFTVTPSVSVIVDASLPVGIYPLVTWGTTSGTAPTAVSVSNIAPGTFASLSIVGNTLSLKIDAIIIKEDNSEDLNLGASWVDGMAPDATKIAVWNDRVTSPNTTALSADVTWAGITIENPAGSVTINGANTLTLGATFTDLNLGTATADLTLNCPLAMDGDNRWDVAATRTLTLGGQVSGSFDVFKVGAGKAVISSASNNYTGNTTISAGTLQLAAHNVIPNGTGTGNVSVAGTLDLNGKSETVNGLSGAGIIDNTLAATSPILTVGANDQTSTFSGVIRNTTGSVNLVKTGTGSLVLGGANTLSGSVTVNEGTLAYSNTAPLANASSIALAAGTTLRSDVGSATIAPPISLGAADTIVRITAPTSAGSGSTPVPVTISSPISGDGDVRFLGLNSTNSYGTIILAAPGTYTGDTFITCSNELATEFTQGNQNIFVRLGVPNALPVTTVVTLDGGNGTGGGRFCELNLNGNSQTLAGLTNATVDNLRSQEVYNASGTHATLTVNNTAPFTYSGKLGGQVGPTGTSGDNLSLTKSGAGAFTISGANTYTGATTVSDGTLVLGATNTLPNASAVAIGAGTLNAATSGTETTGTLNVTGAATIHLATGAQLDFANSSLVNTGTWAGMLNITGDFVSGTSLNFGSANGLTIQQLSKISATGFTNFGLDAEGDLTANVVSVGTFSDWMIANAPATGFATDSDNDGLANGVENVLGSNPNTFNAGLTEVSATATSVIFKHTLNPTVASDVTYGYEWSTNLVEWKTSGQTNTGGTTATVAASPPALGVVTVTVTITGGTTAKLFGRLVAEN